MKLQIPQKLQFLATKQARYKVAFGGRGGGKSYAYADMLIIKALDGARILCTRELQNSIKDSVHRLISDRIAHHGLSKCFDITENEIRCLGSPGLFIFKGLRQNITEIKSMEGIKFCWVEEANKVCAESWDILTPTIREPESEIWISFNTGGEEDEAYKRFVKEGRPGAIVEKVNWYDNPWFPEVLKAEMEWDRKNAPDRYKHVWLGEPALEGKFFVEFGPHLKENPFNLQPTEMQGRLFSSLDSGTTHATSFGLYWLEQKQDSVNTFIIHGLFTYQGTGLTIRTHAEEIYNRIEAFPFTQGYFPDICVADPSMWTKVKMNEFSVRSPIDEYIELFAQKGKPTRFQKANNDKINGCQIMRMLFKNIDNAPAFRYFDVYNKSMEEGINRVEVDVNTPEMYMKKDGDDDADRLRYGLVYGNSLIGMMKQRQVSEKPKTHLERLLAGEFRSHRSSVSEDWYQA